jgi:hypothetical protein
VFRAPNSGLHGNGAKEPDARQTGTIAACSVSLQVRAGIGFTPAWHKAGTVAALDVSIDSQPASQVGRSGTTELARRQRSPKSLIRRKGYE